MEESICKRCENARICGRAILDNKNVIMTGCSRFEKLKATEFVLVVRCGGCKWGNGGYCEYIGDMIPCGDWENWFCPSGEVKE